MLAFSNDYYGFIFRATQSVELFCAYFGTVKVGEKGQIVIPKEARQIFDIKSGDTLLVLGDEEQGIAIVKADVMKELAVKILKGLGKLSNGIEDEK